MCCIVRAPAQLLLTGWTLLFVSAALLCVSYAHILQVAVSEGPAAGMPLLYVLLCPIADWSVAGRLHLRGPSILFLAFVSVPALTSFRALLRAAMLLRSMRRRECAQSADDQSGSRLGVSYVGNSRASGETSGIQPGRGILNKRSILGRYVLADRENRRRAFDISGAVYCAVVFFTLYAFIMCLPDVTTLPGISPVRRIEAIGIRSTLVMLKYGCLLGVMCCLLSVGEAILSLETIKWSGGDWPPVGTKPQKAAVTPEDQVIRCPGPAGTGRGGEGEVMVDPRGQECLGSARDGQPGSRA
ncbi:MAG: hypothetical protein KatS3mg110_0935 [Pirellulaceae bacterium]|nr:MAG: hypothetical protein KatS3mg110_0935 [Pirellulaceae bacterium]